jgi:uncharacterized membrane protein YkgB
MSTPATQTDLRDTARRVDRQAVQAMRQWAVPSLRGALALVYVWFGILKIVRESPVEPLIEDAYPRMPYPAFHYLLGAWEIAIGAGLAAPLVLPKDKADAVTRGTLAAFWIQLAGTMAPVVLAPGKVWKRKPLLLTMTGEFIAKNLVLAAAGVAIGSSVRPASRRSP